LSLAPNNDLNLTVDAFLSPNLRQDGARVNNFDSQGQEEPKAVAQALFDFGSSLPYLQNITVDL
jgi:hypothetical protein